ncbi:MAG: hypothetical protein OQK79_00930, partial [Rhodanobacter sp.]|nr:hypothetical protein [Rhodanobacter sp.]
MRMEQWQPGTGDPHHDRTVATRIRDVDARPEAPRSTHAEGHDRTSSPGASTAHKANLAPKLHNVVPFPLSSPITLLMRASPAIRQHPDSPGQRHEFATYLAQRMGPMIHALMTTALIAYLVGIVARRAVHVSSAPLLLQLALAPPLLLLIMAARRIREPLPLRMLALLCVLLLEIGINLNGMTPSAGIPHALPGLLLPVASSVIWLGRWDFLTAMALCALGPLPMVMHSAEGAQIIQYAVYMAISVALASVLRAFMTR